MAEIHAFRWAVHYDDIIIYIEEYGNAHTDFRARTYRFLLFDYTVGAQ